MDFSAKLSLPYLLPNQAEKHVTLNTSLRRLDAIVQLSVRSETEPSSPDDPGDGDRYIVPPSGTEDWAGRAGQIASYQDGGWAYYQPQTGWLAWVEDTGTLRVFDGADWANASDSAGASNPDQLGINANPDTTNRLAVQSPASLFSHEGGDHQVKINKAGDTDFASLLFQSDWSGHAEIGLTGSNDLQVKVSPDGSAFASAIYVQAEDGAVGIGTQAPTTPLHVNGPIRLPVLPRAELPDPQSVGAGALIFYAESASSTVLLYSDGTNWRQVRTNTPVIVF